MVKKNLLTLLILKNHLVGQASTKKLLPSIQWDKPCFRLIFSWDFRSWGTPWKGQSICCRDSMHPCGSHCAACSRSGGDLEDSRGNSGRWVACTLLCRYNWYNLINTVIFCCQKILDDICIPLSWTYSCDEFNEHIHHLQLVAPSARGQLKDGVNQPKRFTGVIKDG